MPLSLLNYFQNLQSKFVRALLHKSREGFIL